MAITLEYLSYSGAKDNTGGGCRAVFDFQGSDGGSLYVGYTFQIGFDYEPKAAVLANNVVVEGLTGVITEVAHETASYATGKLEIYALQYGTTYEIQTFDMSGTPMSDITFTPQANNSIKAKNLVSGTLADDITTSTTNILVHIADNISAQDITDFFPTAPFYITIMPKAPANGVSNRLDSEIIKITNVGNDQVGNAALTGVRAQRDTTAKSFSTGDIVTVGVYAEDAVFLSEDGTNRKQLKNKDGNVIYPDVGVLGTSSIEDGAIITQKLANDAVTTGKLANLSISTDKIAAGAVTNGKIANGAVNSAKIENGAVSTAKIPDGAVTPGKASFTKYSTNEQVVGTWIDGKPIYRKVFHITNPQTSNADYDLVSNKLNHVIKLYGYMETTNNPKIPIPQTDSSSTYSVVFVTTSGKIRGRFAFMGAVPTSVYVVVEYTKTTD